MAANIPAFTVEDAMLACGVPAAPLFNQQSPARRLARDLFADDFTTAMDKTFTELEDDFKTYSNLTNAQGQIRLLPGVKNNIKAFVQWTRDELRMNRDPATTPFPNHLTNVLLRRYKTHKQFLDSVDEATKPKDFATTIKWDDWFPTFSGYLRRLAGRDGVPLSYVVRANDAGDPTPRPNFLDEYVANAPLNGEAFVIDNERVANILIGLIVGNSEAETKVQSVANQEDGRGMVRALQEHYAGVGIYANDIVRAEKIVDSLFYNGEKRPYMWWDEFERQLIWAYSTLDRIEGRQVYSDVQKLRKLVEKVKADFLLQTKTNVSMQANRNPPDTTFVQAVADFRMAVRAKYPAEITANTRTTRRQINEIGRGGRGRGRHGRGRGRGRGGGRGQSGRRTREDSEMIRLTNGREIEYHPSFHFPDDVIRHFSQEQMDRLREQRAEYKRRRQSQGRDGQSRSIQEIVRAELQSFRDGQSLANDTASVPAEVNTGNETAAQVSQVTTGTRGTTMFRGRNEQAAQRGSHS